MVLVLDSCDVYSLVSILSSCKIVVALLTSKWPSRAFAKYCDCLQMTKRCTRHFFCPMMMVASAKSSSPQKLLSLAILSRMLNPRWSHVPVDQILSRISHLERQRRDADKCECVLSDDVSQTLNAYGRLRFDARGVLWGVLWFFESERTKLRFSKLTCRVKLLWNFQIRTGVQNAQTP